ncbi:MAG: YfcE family phosphodiesterase [Chloroflexota bacterium]|nr:YfcE family phosphodiesterase [Chloroflexota bacterium]
MLVGVISDIHDNIWALNGVLGELGDCDVLLCLGDLCAPFTMTAIMEGFDGPVHLVWGNNDGDKVALTESASEAGDITIHGIFGEVRLDGRSIAMTHYPAIARALASNGRYDLVCYGHSHEAEQTVMGRTLLLNPGEVMGRLGAPSFAMYDTRTGEAEIRHLA